MNFAPADCFLILILLMAAGQLKYCKAAWTVWHVGIVLTFATGSLVAASSFGELARYELVNKDAGLLLPLLSYAAITSLVTEWADLLPSLDRLQEATIDNDGKFSPPALPSPAKSGVSCRPPASPCSICTSAPPDRLS